MNWFSKPDIYDVFIPGRYSNPYAYYCELRKSAPVHYYKKHGFWAISRYKDIDHILKTPEDFSSINLLTKLKGTIVDKDLAEHSAIRKKIAGAFTPKRVKKLEEWIQNLVVDYVDKMIAGGRGEFMKDISIPLPMMIVIELLKLDPAYFEDYVKWANVVVFETIGKKISGRQLREMDKELQKLNAFCEAQIKRRKAAGENIFNDVLMNKTDSDELSIPEAINLTKLLMVAGGETTTNFFANVIVALLQNPDELALLRAKPELMPAMIEEALRFDSPTQYVLRRTRREVELSGHKIPENSTLLVLTGSANHDEEIFPDPERFSIERNPRGHFGFGAGPHYCLGAHIARLETTMIFKTLLERVKSFHCTHPLDELVYSHSLNLRRLQKLELTFELKKDLQSVYK